MYFSKQYSLLRFFVFEVKPFETKLRQVFSCAVSFSQQHIKTGSFY